MTSFTPRYKSLSETVYEYFNPLFRKQMVPRIHRLCPGEPLIWTPNKITLEQIQRICQRALSDLDNRDYMEALSIAVRAYNYDKYQYPEKTAAALAVPLNNALYETVNSSYRNNALRKHLKETYKMNDVELDQFLRLDLFDNPGADMAKLLLSTNFVNARDLINFQIGLMRTNQPAYRP